MYKCISKRKLKFIFNLHVAKGKLKTYKGFQKVNANLDYLLIILKRLKEEGLDAVDIFVKKDCPIQIGKEEGYILAPRIPHNELERYKLSLNEATADNSDFKTASPKLKKHSNETIIDIREKAYIEMFDFINWLAETHKIEWRGYMDEYENLTKHTQKPKVFGIPETKSVSKDNNDFKKVCFQCGREVYYDKDYVGKVICSDCQGKPFPKS